MAFAFKLGSISIRVHAWFVVFAVLLGLTTQQTPAGVVLWSATLVVAVLAHELGHAVVARGFGVPATVDLSPFAPVAERHLAKLPPLHRVLVSLAGPTVSIVLGILATVLGRGIDPAHVTLAAAVHHLAWINVGWGILNLAPMLPFDGGYVLLALADKITRGRGERPIRLGSAAFALVLAVASLVAHLAFPALLCGVVALQNARGLRVREDEQQEILARVHLKAAFEAVEQDDLSGGIEHCRNALRMSSNDGLRKDAVRLLAYAYVAKGAWTPLVRLLESSGATVMDDAEIEKYERAALELGRAEDARRIAQLRWQGPHQAA